MHFRRVVLLLALCAAVPAACGHRSQIAGLPATPAAQSVREPFQQSFGVAPAYYAVALPAGFVPYAIMRNGRIAGAQGNQAAIYANGNITLLASDPKCEAGTTTATGVNGFNQAVGFCRIAQQATAALYFANGTVRELRRPGSIQLWGFLEAWAINDTGEIYGAAYSWGQSSGPSLARFFTDNSPTQVFGGDSGMAQNVFLSNSGRFAFTNFVYLEGSFASVGFKSNLKRLFPNQNDTGISGINDDDAAVGTNGNGMFLYSHGSTTLVPLPTGIISMSPAGINNRGQVVGQACAKKRCDEIFLYSSAGIVDVTPLISPRNNYSVLSGLSDDGSFIVQDPQGNYDLIQPAKPLFVANWLNSEVNAYAAPYSGAPISRTSYFLSGPVGIAFDAKGNLFVADSGAGEITEYAPPYTGEPIARIRNGIYRPTGVAFDRSGDLFVACADTVKIYAPPYTGAPIGKVTNGMFHPDAVAFDSKGNLFVANLGNTTVTEYAPPYTAAPIISISNRRGYPRALAFDPSGDLFVANDTRLQNFDAVVEYAPPYTGSPVTLVTNGVNAPYGLAMDASGNLFVANFSGNNVTAYAPPYTGGPMLTITNSVNTPRGLAFGP